MMNCKDVENNLPLYEDNLLSGAEKQAVEQHLKSCSKCAKALAQLKKTGRLVEGLEEVEPPPWFKQKIMSRVREEAEKKSLAQKWFYPLRIKIPVQIMATIVIAVLAVYIYRSGDEQMKVVMPPTSPTPVMETKKDLFSEQTTKLSEADKTVVKKKVYVPEGAQNEKIVTQDLPAGSSVVKTRGLKKSMAPGNERARTMDMAKTVKGDAAVDRKDTYFATLPEKQTEQAKVVSPSSVGLERKKEGYVLGDSMKQSEVPAKQIIMPKAVFSLRASNTNAAVEEVEKILKKYEAKKIVKQTPNGKVFLTAEIQAQKMNDFVAQLKTIGRVEGKDMPMDSVEGDIRVVIKIVSN
jgi:glutaredoxin-related protein